VAFENLTQAVKLLGQSNVIDIATNKNIPLAMLAIMGAEDSKLATEMVLWFTQQARIDGSKITANSMDDLGMHTIVELFAHVLYSQYNDFFVSGLAKEASPE
jgi:hypothetical protein